MKIDRIRYVVCSENKILCSYQGNLEFCGYDDVGDSKVQTYSSAEKALVALYNNLRYERPIKIQKVKETIEFLKELYNDDMVHGTPVYDDVPCVLGDYVRL